MLTKLGTYLVLKRICLLVQKLMEIDSFYVILFIDRMEIKILLQLFNVEKTLV